MKVTPLVASRFFVDGGAMFGLLPKPIWSKTVQANERNAILQHINSLLVELDDGRLGLVEPGCGHPAKYSDKMLSIHGMDLNWPLEEALAALGHSRENIDFVVISHLHWDHAGGVIMPDGSLTFPRAIHYVGAEEWASAMSRDPLHFKAYPEEVLEPLEKLSGDTIQRVPQHQPETVPGIQLVLTGGHSKGHCVVVIEHQEISFMSPGRKSPFEARRLVYAADVCPMVQHMRMVVTMAFDTYPMDTRAWKRDWLPRMEEQGDVLLFDHDPGLFGCTLQTDPKLEFVPSLRFPVEPET